MFELSNYDLFEEFFNFIKNENTTVEVALKEYGGCNFYIPSYKTTARNEKIIEEYLQMKKEGSSHIAKKLSRKYELSEQQIYAVTQEARWEAERK